VPAAGDVTDVQAPLPDSLFFKNPVRSAENERGRRVAFGERHVAAIQFDLKSGLGIRLARGSARKGFTLLEVTLAMSVLVIAMMAISATTLRVHALRRENHDRAAAENAVRMIAERIQAVSRLARSDPAGWAQNVVAALNPGGQIGNQFPLPELTPIDGATSVGSITVVTSENATDAALGAELGMPRDLDGDGVVGNPDVTHTARLLPVIVRATWKGVTGKQVVVHPFYVLGY
jgi:prepilin-type N-terminal cleavage/methylation domain-containing protein